VGQIVPWNFPVMFTSWKMGPALAAGNCVVMKPSEITPLSALRVAELAAEVGFPPGVINMVPGYGATAGQRIVDHPGIAKVSFTGSTSVGKPTIVQTRPEARAAQEEVFGPFMVAHTFKTDDEAVQIANGVAYGLGGGLWTRDLSRAHKVARDLRAGMVWVNSYKRVNPGSPFGGIGVSGYGREMGFEAMREYTEPKATWINIDAHLPAYYPRG
jgi:acyl-CoA reductase-like NAD-dependent aldehyde dehydrogenase